MKRWVTICLCCTLCWMLLASCTANTAMTGETMAPASSPQPIITPTPTPTEPPVETPGIAARLKASLFDFVTPTPLPEYTPEQTVFAEMMYSGESDENGRWIYTSTLSDRQGNALELPSRIDGIYADNTYPVDPGNLNTLMLPGWAVEQYSYWDAEHSLRMNRLPLGCYILRKGETIAVMRLDGELVTDFDYHTTIADVYGPSVFSHKGYLRIEGHSASIFDSETYSKYPSVYGLVDIRTGKEILPQTYVALDLYDGYIYAANDTGGHFIFDYDGNVLLDLSEYHQSLKDWVFPLDMLISGN